MSEFETTIHRGIDLSAFYALHLLRPYGRVILQTFSPGILTGHSGWEGNVRLLELLIKDACTWLKCNTLFAQIDRSKWDYLGAVSFKSKAGIVTRTGCRNL